MASSPASVRAEWVGKQLREAFAQEEERVRARLIGALVSGDHLDVTEPFYEAFRRGGIERAATFEMLPEEAQRRVPRRSGALEAPVLRRVSSPALECCDP